MWKPYVERGLLSSRSISAKETKKGSEMKIAISSAGKSLESETDPRFGRCKYFLVVNTETEEFEVLPNENAERMGGAGIKAAQLAAGLELDSVITGNIGPNAFEVLSTAGIQVMTGATGTITDAIEAFKQGQLERAEAHTVESHSGMGEDSRFGTSLT
jgi:predicted Fe-Mo cluster-binding NifX family protein